jgi:hypothetical protein
MIVVTGVIIDEPVGAESVIPSTTAPDDISTVFPLVTTFREYPAAV